MSPCTQCKMKRKFDYLKLHREERLPAHRVAQLAGVHENTIYNWKVVYEKGGFEALRDKSRAPNTHPNEFSVETKEAIRFLRREGFKKEKRHLGGKILIYFYSIR